MNKTAKILIWLVVLALLAWGLSSLNKKAPVNPASGEVIKIGAIYPLTGGLTIYGEPAQKATEIAVADINMTGGINGRPLEVVFEDHKCDPKTAVSAFKKLSTEGITVFTSVACSGTALAIAPELENNKAVLLGTTLSTPKISGASPLLFRNWASDIQESKLFADQINKLGYKKVAMIYEETDYAKGVALNTQIFLKDFGIDSFAESFSPGAIDVRTQLTKVKAYDPDIILVSVQTVTSGEIVLQQIEQLGLKARLLVNDNIIASPRLISTYRSLEGSLGAQYVLLSHEIAEEFFAKYKTKYGTDCPQPTVCAAVYDTVSILAKSLRDTEGTAEQVRHYLSGINYDGASGRVSFDSNNDRIGATYSLFTVKNGELKLME